MKICQTSPSFVAQEEEREVLDARGLLRQSIHDGLKAWQGKPFIPPLLSEKRARHQLGTTRVCLPDSSKVFCFFFSLEFSLCSSFTPPFLQNQKGKTRVPPRSHVAGDKSSEFFFEKKRIRLRLV